MIPFIYKLTRKKTQTITLIGTDGTANINIGGVNYLATFNSTLTTTASDFDTSHSAALTTAGFTVTNSSGALTFISVVSGFDYALSITNVTNSLTGSVAVPSKVQANFELDVDVNTISSNFTIQQIRNLDQDPTSNNLNSEAETLKRIAFHEADLFDYATDEDATLVRKTQQGGSPSTLRAEA